MIDLSGKTAVITGASRGVGAGIAKACQRRGMNIAICARSEPTIDPSESVLSLAADVSREDDVLALADQTVERFGAIDLWINNAGLLEPINLLRNCKSEDVQRHLDVNIMGVFHGTKAFINHLHGRDGEGVLINISSGAATSVYEGWGPYCAGKAAVDHMTRVADLEEAKNGLRAYSVAPGIIDTSMQELIRSTDRECFPMLDKFIELKENDAFSSPEFVANELLALAFDPERRPESVCSRLPMEE